MQDPNHRIEALRSEFATGKRIKYVFFWGHTRLSADTVGKECLSQWYPAKFSVDGVAFSSAEHFMMVEKAKLFGDHESATKILGASSPGAAKAFGRAVRGFDEGKWVENRVRIAIAGNLAKFSQMPALRDFLLNTKQRVLVEASPVDRIWGIGLETNNPHIENPLSWRGMNLLGFALMDVRDSLRRDQY